MITYRELDAWKVCHELTLGVYQATKSMLDTEPDIAHQIRLAALLATAKLARGAGTGNMVMFRECAGMSAGHLSEVSYYLSIAHVLGFMTDETRKNLDALRGRALFYVWKLLCPAPNAREDGTASADVDG